MENFIKVFVPICFNVDYDEGGIALDCFGITDKDEKIELAEHFAEFKPGEYEQQADECRQIKIDGSAYKREIKRLNIINNNINKKENREYIKRIGIKVLCENPHF